MADQFYGFGSNMQKRYKDNGDGSFSEVLAFGQSGSYSTGTVTILSGQAVSPVISLANGGRLAGLIIPAAWVPASISFKVSVDGTTFFAFKQGGTLVSIPVSALDAVDLLGAYPGLTAWPYVQIVASAAVSADRIINYVAV